MMKAWLRLPLVLVTVGGGCAGVLASIQLFGGPSSLGVRHTGAPSHLGLRWALMELICFGVYSFLTAAGLWFVYDANKTRPILFAFALLIPWVDLPGFRYQIYALLYAAMTFGPPHGNGKIGTYVEWSANLGTHVDLRIGGLPEGNWSVGLNLFALLIVLILLWYERTTDTRAASGLKSQVVPESLGV